MPRKIIVMRACCVLLLMCAGACRAQDWDRVRSPLGVYVHVDIETAISGYTGPSSPGDTELHKYLRNLYEGVLADPAISGITVGRRWDNIQTSDPACILDHSCLAGPDGYDWSYLDDVFEAAHAAHKPVQLIITPGFDSPPWLLAKLPPCDDLVSGGPVAPDCGTVKFVGFPEVQRADGKVLPLPWNPVYQAAWADFLVHLNYRYKDDPAFVSIAVAGAVGASDEIILPTTADVTMAQPSGVPVDRIWSDLIQHSFPFVTSYQNTDQVFIDSWKQAIDTYERIFAGITLIVSADAGNDLPEFSDTIPAHPDALYAVDCSAVKNEIMSCEAKTEILAYFVSVRGPNGKATEVGGMTASSLPTPGDIGIAGVKVLTSLWPRPWPPIRGGAQFDHAVSTDPQGEGCPGYPQMTCTGISVEEGAFNVLKVFFDGTPASRFYGGLWGTAPIQYLEVDLTDVQYAQMKVNQCPAAPSTTLGETSLQDLLNRASHDLFEMASRFAPLPPPTCRMTKW